MWRVLAAALVAATGTGGLQAQEEGGLSNHVRLREAIGAHHSLPDLLELPEPEITASPETELLDAAELDTLVAPVALYPDTLLTQVLIAATYPLQVVKAARLIEAGPEMSDEDLSEAVAAPGWDPSVLVLLSDFPSLIERMAEELEWTERLGNAMIEQEDDVFAAVERSRLHAEQSSETIDEAFALEGGAAYAFGPLDPDDVDAATASISSRDNAPYARVPYSAPPLPAPYRAEPETTPYTYGTTYGQPYQQTYGSTYGQSYGQTYGNAYDPSYGQTYGNSYDQQGGVSPLITGAAALGTALLVNQLFGDDDDDDQSARSNEWRRNHGLFWDRDERRWRREAVRRDGWATGARRAYREAREAREEAGEARRTAREARREVRDLRDEADERRRQRAEREQTRREAARKAERREEAKKAERREEAKKAERREEAKEDRAQKQRAEERAKQRRAEEKKAEERKAQQGKSEGKEKSGANEKSAKASGKDNTDNDGGNRSAKPQRANAAQGGDNKPEASATEAKQAGNPPRNNQKKASGKKKKKQRCRGDNKANCKPQR